MWLEAKWDDHAALFLAGFILLYSILPMSHHVIEEEGVKHMGDNLQAITWQEDH